MGDGEVGELNSLAKLLILMGAGLAVLGIIILLAGRWTPIGRLPGDIIIRRENFVFYFPLITCLVLSLLLTLVINLLFRR